MNEGEKMHLANRMKGRADAKVNHMKRRVDQHGSLRKAAEEFGVSHSTVHRKLRDMDDEEG